MATIQHPTLLAFENNAGRIIREPAGYIRLQWLADSVGSTDVRTLFEHFLWVQVQADNSRHLLIDQRLARPFSEADREWLTHEWLPYCTQLLGFHYAAHILAQNVFTRLSSVAVMAKARSLHLNHQAFEDEATALTWLLQQPCS